MDPAHFNVSLGQACHEGSTVVAAVCLQIGVDRGESLRCALICPLLSSYLAL